jgi:hypothetical protein
MDRNQLTGTIPSFLGMFTRLIYLQLHTNELNGTIPSSLEALTGLMVDLGLSNNNLTGTIPSSLGALTVLAGLWLFNNQLNGTLSLCDDSNRTFDNVIADCAKVSCPHCCPTAGEDGTIPVFDKC